MNCGRTDFSAVHKMLEAQTTHNQANTTYILDKFKTQLHVLATVNSHQQVA
jgi:hypothetical protein